MLLSLFVEEGLPYHADVSSSISLPGELFVWPTVIYLASLEVICGLVYVCVYSTVDTDTYVTILL